MPSLIPPPPPLPPQHFPGFHDNSATTSSPGSAGSDQPVDSSNNHTQDHTADYQSQTASRNEGSEKTPASPGSVSGLEVIGNSLSHLLGFLGGVYGQGQSSRFSKDKRGQNSDDHSSDSLDVSGLEGANAGGEGINPLSGITLLLTFFQ